MTNEIIEALSKLYSEEYNCKFDSIEQLKQSGSYRQYYRITKEGKSILGVYNDDLRENNAYLSFSSSFEKEGINIPKIIRISNNTKTYLIQDLGNQSLWDIAQKNRKKDGSLSETSLKLFKETLKALIHIQCKTIEHIDLSYCYPRDTFDKQSMLWDLNYFKYFFLRLLRVNTDEQLFENDIQRLATKLNEQNQNYFLYRDFQSRNIMIFNNEPYFIDFQGGRKGSTYYDLASLIYDANIELVNEDQEELIHYYLEEWSRTHSITKKEFINNFHQFAIIRLTQALGAFGLRGIIENKPHFKECIPYALSSLKAIFEDSILTQTYPEIAKCIKTAIKSDYIRKLINK